MKAKPRFEVRCLDCARHDRGERKFYDFIPPLLEKKYLKTIFNCHDCAQILGKGDLAGDGVITVLDIEFDHSRNVKEPHVKRGAKYGELVGTAHPTNH